jgi:hypothetical protein
VNVAGSGSVAKNPNKASYHLGDSVVLTATPQTGWSFSGWSGAFSSSVNPVTVIINGTTSVTAAFTQIEYSLTVSTIGSGSVVLNNTGPYHYGDRVQLTASPTVGWSFSVWGGDLSGSVNPTTILIGGNKAVTATFTRNTYTPFSIVSNSTVTQIAFNSTSKVLKFTVSGYNDTYGFTNVTIAKTVISDISTLTVYLDGNQMNYTVNDLTDSWLIYFTYHHSTHRVVIEFTPQQTKTSSTPSNAVTVAIIGLTIVISTALAITTKRKRRLSNFTKRKH